MTDDDDVVEPCGLDIGDYGVHRVGDCQGPQIPWLASSPWQIYGEHREFWCLPADFVDGEVPAVGGVHRTVDKHQCR